MPTSAFTPSTAPLSLRPRAHSRPSQQARRVVAMANHATTGPFAPIVRATRAVMGEKDFNQLRGKAIALHSDVIKVFCDNIGADKKIAQSVIRTAKKNGEKLGFLA